MAESWGWYLGKMVAKTAGKIALNFVAPGSGAFVEFTEAAYDLYNGDKIGCAINIASGALDIVSFGAASSVKGAMKESSKKAVVNTAKREAKSAAKKATKKVGQELTKQLAKGTITSGEKEVAIQFAKGAAKTAANEATKEVGRKISYEIARGVVSDAIEEVLREGGKITVNNVVQKAVLASLSSGGKQIPKACSEAFFHQVVEQIFSEMMKTNKREIVYQFTKEAAKTAAEDELKKHTVKVLALDTGIAVVKGGMNRVLKKDDNTAF